MPVGIIVNVISVIVGGVLGTLLGKKLSQSFIEILNMIFGLSAMTMGINSVVQMKNMPIVILSIILGTMVGVLVHLGEIIGKGASNMQKATAKYVTLPESKMKKEEATATLVTVIVLFCASGTGIYGAIISGINGDHSILFVKSVLDFFTAMIFACSSGMVISLVSIPQLLIFMALFFLAKIIGPLCSDSMIGDFKACGGIILLATGLRMLKLKQFPIADMIPAMVLVMPFSFLWTQYVLPRLY